MCVCGFLCGLFAWGLLIGCGLIKSAQEKEAETPVIEKHKRT